MSNKSLIVIGMHRSGTSALSGELARLGVFMGKSLYKAQAGVNDKGFWENARLVAINEDIHDDIISSWDDPLGLLKQQYAPNEKLAKRALKLVVDEYLHTPLSGMKDPRVSILLPFWQKTLDQLNIQPHYILMIRHPIEVAASLSKRDGFSQEKGLMLWLNYNFASFLQTQNKSRVIVNFDDLLQNPATISRKIAKTFSLTLPDSGNNSFIDASLKRQRAVDDKPNEYGILLTLSIELFSAICLDDAIAVALLRERYQTYLDQLDTVLVEHLNSVQKSEIHFRTIFEQAYNTFTWKLMRPFKKIEEKIVNTIKGY